MLLLPIWQNLTETQHRHKIAFLLPFTHFKPCFTQKGKKYHKIVKITPTLTLLRGRAGENHMEQISTC